MPELMDGVTYLYTIPAEKPWSLVWCAIIGAVAIALLVVISGLQQRIDVETIVFCAITFSTLGGMLGAVIGISINGALPPERYAVTVSDTVRMNEFLEKYEIVELKENAYIIQMRENEIIE